MKLTYTQTLIDACPKPPQCSRCGRVFEVGDMIHEIPINKTDDDIEFSEEYKLVCRDCQPFPDLGDLFECDDCSWCGKPTMPGDTMYHIATKGVTRIYCSKCGKAIKDRI